MKKVNAMEMRNIEGGAKITAWCYMCGKNRTYKGLTSLGCSWKHFLHLISCKG